ncbi:hypothetical protein EMPS_07695 [Entomortierella parvispora]|uniref:GATA-type domain-containing protein n=1 Tax=Entomortierella parvispora TaxID=205924 RepID=A0A9P3LYP4_9FUNG|nr:hypothetical protein EMPS_07695 [Entomortierella parvispora]
MDHSSGAPSPAFPHAVANHPPPLPQDPMQDPLLQNIPATSICSAEPPSPGSHPQQQMILQHHSQFATAGIITTPTPTPAPRLDSPKNLPQHRPFSDNTPASPPPSSPHHTPSRWSPKQPLQTERRHRDLDRLEDAQWLVSPGSPRGGPTSSSVSQRDESSTPLHYSPFQALPNQPRSTFATRPTHPLARPVVFDRGSYDQHNPFPTRDAISIQHDDALERQQQRTIAWSKSVGNYSTDQYPQSFHPRTATSQEDASPNRWQESDHDTQEQQRPRQDHFGDDHILSNDINVNGHSSSSSNSIVGKNQSYQLQPSQQRGHHSTQSQPLPSPQPQSHHQSPHHHHAQYTPDRNHAHRPSSSVSTPDLQHPYQNYQQRLKSPPVPMAGSEAHNQQLYNNNDRRSFDRGIVQTEASSSSDHGMGRRYDRRSDYPPSHLPNQYSIHRPLSPPPRVQSQQQHGPPLSQPQIAHKQQSVPRSVYQEELQEVPSRSPDTPSRDSGHVSRQASLGISSRADWVADDRHDRRDRRDYYSESLDDRQVQYHDEQRMRQYREQDTAQLRSQQGHAISYPTPGPYPPFDRQPTPPITPGADNQGTSLKNQWDRKQAPDEARGSYSMDDSRMEVDATSDRESDWRTKARTKEDLQFRFGTDMPKTVDLKSAIESCDILCQFALHFASQDPRQLTRRMEGDGTPVDPNDRATLQRIRNLAGTMLVGLQHTESGESSMPTPSDDQSMEEELGIFETNGNHIRPNGSGAATDREPEETPQFGKGSPSNEMVHELAKAATSIFQLAVRIKAWVNMTAGERELDEEINIIRGKRCLFLDEMTPLSMQPTHDLNGGMSGYPQQHASTPLHPGANRSHIPGFGSASAFPPPGVKRPMEDSMFTRFGGAASKRGGGNKMTKLLKTGMESDSDAMHQKYRKRAKRTHPLGRCLSCDTTDTPEWRRGPDGARTLCNACGLHYAKLVKRQKQQQQLQGQDPQQESPAALIESTLSNETSANGSGALVVHGSGPALPPGPNILDYTVGTRSRSRSPAQSASESHIDSSGMDDDTAKT